MKSKFVLSVVIAALSYQSATATLFFTDQFNYTAGANLGAATGGGGAVWTLPSGDVSQIAISSGATLTPPDGFAGAAGLGIAVTPTGSRKATGVPFNGATGIPVADGNVVYASFLLDMRTLPVANLRVAYLHNSAASSAGIEVVVSSSGQIGIQKKGSGTTFVSGTPVATQGAHLVVMRYTFQSGNDEVAVWVDPASASYDVNPAPTTGAFAATTGGGSDMSSAITYFMIESAAVTGPVFWLDEVRVGTTWADVTPTNGPVAPPPAPVITQALLSAQGMILRGSNGPASSTYQVLTSSTLALPPSNWPSVAAHSFDATGNFDSTNPITLGHSQQFFRLQVGGAVPLAPTAPAITHQPQSLNVALSNDVAFTVTATGTTPLHYQWCFNTNTPVGGNSNTFALLNVQSNAIGSYSVVVTNNYGAVTSAFATLNIGAPLSELARYNLVGFGAGTTGGGVIPDTDPAYRKVYTALELATAVRDVNKTAGSVKVIEVMNDLNLGWNEIDPAVKLLSSTPFSQPQTPLLHPVLLQTGVSTMQISPKSGLTIFSANGATIRHASWSIKNTANIIIRNLKFDELWEWDENTKGNYDRNNWDMIVIGVGGGTVSQVWVDHCTFTKAYDGTVDTKGGADHITYSWNKYAGDDGATNPNSFVWQQINALEANLASYPMYNFLRTRGFSAADIVAILQGSGKTHAIGELSRDPVNENSCVTFHHQWYVNPWDRLPRLAGGTVHNYNIYVDAPQMLAARRLRDAKVTAMSPADQTTFANNYNFRPSGNGSISTENGAMLVEKSVYIDCVWPLRNNQTDPSNPIYTGKIMALDTIYSFLESNGSTTYVRGNSTDPGNPLGPFQAPIIPFSWNTNSGTPNGVLPYTYTMDDPAQLQSIVTSPIEGAGAGVLTWNKTNWLKTSY
jgi:pectate lyase